MEPENIFRTEDKLISKLILTSFMGERYFNLKIGSKKVHGLIIRVNPDETDLEKRVQEFGGELKGYGVSSSEFKMLKRGKEAVTYQMEIPDQEYMNVGGVPVAGKAGPSTVVKLRVLSTGELSLDWVPKRIKVYLSEMSKKKAKKLEEEAESFSLMRAYVCG